MQDPLDQHPWVFRRDDVDLLEDQLEDLYRRFQWGETEIPTMEQEVLKEQLGIEESSDLELSMVLGEQLLDSMVDRFHGETPSTPPPNLVSEDVSLSLSEQRDPLYAEARVWALQVFAFAREQYTVPGVRCRELFRVYVNVNLIPIKIANAVQEELMEDTFAQEVALKDYELAETYLERVRSDLEFLILNGVHPQQVNRFLVEGIRLAGLVAMRKEALKRRRKDV